VSFWIHAAAAKHPDRVAIESPERSLTYAELSSAAIGAAGALRRLGADAGSRVALALPAGPEFVIALHGCLLLGAAAVPVDLRLSELERAERMGGADVVVTEPLGAARVGMPSVSGGGQAVAVMHTSGTTAAPKRVELSDGNFLASALGSAVALGLDPAERWLCPMPLTHVGGLSIPIRSAIYATTAVLHGRFDTDAVLGELMDGGRRITLVSLVPTMLARLLDAHAPLHEYRAIVVGGAPLPAALRRRALDAGAPVVDAYGLSETGGGVVVDGRPIPGADVRRGDGDEILLRGPMVMRGYRFDPDGTRRVLDADGWLHTADVGAWDDDGAVRVVDRRRDLVITGGVNVSPTTVEQTLGEHPDIVDVCVAGAPDADWGERVVAFIVTRAGSPAPSLDELRAFARDRLRAAELPRQVVVVDAIPRTAGGKARRGQLPAPV
jgi:O-succinylbenzoic acid--CoA ligase